VKRRDFITLLGGAAAAWPLSARAQQSAKILHVGFLYPGPLVGAAPRIVPFTSGLQAGGLRVPDQVMVIPGVTDGNAALLAPMATDLVARKVDAEASEAVITHLRCLNAHPKRAISRHACCVVWGSCPNGDKR
jgi:hypothetical protein